MKYIQYGSKTLTMPEHMTLEQAKQLMARHFPELAENPKIDTKKEGDDTTYFFYKQAGRKGIGRRATDAQRAAQRLQRLKPVEMVSTEIETYVAGKMEMVMPKYESLEAEIAAVQRVRTLLGELAPQLDAGSVLL